MNDYISQKQSNGIFEMKYRVKSYAILNRKYRHKLSQLTLLQTQKPVRSPNEIVAKAEHARALMADAAKQLESILQQMMTR